MHTPREGARRGRRFGPQSCGDVVEKGSEGGGELMGWKRWVAPKLALVVLAVVTIAAPAVIAQTPSSNMPAGASVQKTKTIDALGNTVVTERTFINGRLAKQEVTVTSPAGQLVSKTETVFNAAGQVAKRETVTVNAGTVTKTEQKFANGQLVREEVTTTTLNNGQRVTVEREFKLVNGVLKEVKEERKVEKVEKAEPDDHGAKGAAGANRGKDKDEKEMEAAESEHQGGAEHGGGDGGHGDGSGHAH